MEFGWTDEQKQKYIPRFISGEYIGNFVMTESDFGSDVAGMKCRAEDKGDYFLVNGARVFATNGTICDHGLLYLKTDRDAGSGPA